MFGLVKKLIKSNELMIDTVADCYIGSLEMGYPINVTRLCEEMSMNEEDINKVNIRIKERQMNMKINNLQKDFNEEE